MTSPTVTGTPVYGGTLTADPGQWSPAVASFGYQWLRAGVPIAGAVAATYTPGLDDLGRTLAVQVTAGDGSGVSTSPQTAPVARATMTASRQRVLGEPRYTHTLKARPGRFSAPDPTVTYTWPGGDTARTYEIRPGDVGTKVVLRIRAEAPGYEPLTVKVKSATVGYRIDARRTVRYHVETRGRITTSLEEFRTQAQQTYDDPRGWRSAGIRFVPVKSGGAFTLVLAEAGYLPRFSSGCSAMWSCRVGRFVIINQDRWKNASPAWNAAHLALRDYRHMVVNHETGHWLGLGHAQCPGPGRLAPVMQQQSKGLQGCRFNPFPTAHEIASRTPRGRAMAYLGARGYSPDVE
ncbi:MAG TPA: DUF3152 domain-containing protein [Nocardioides sp.]|uniref:DUF3152 domain-containing protein n=1 Tax=uncultured Nocardioides sp. TaxID=198441 RepID=UPI00262F2E4E|nr:DUF3152 domain-containing protein [uncultured Nocardioides sp.]HRI95046.1 DUF3152 domain-containing protein [Nocardioides sp.]